MKFQPTLMHERVHTIDILRGVSLLGILLVNMFGFYLPQPHIDIAYWFTEAKDIMWRQTLDIYVQSSFYPLFSMLFGYGLAMQYMKSQRTGSNFYKFAPKRLFILFGIGLIHAFLIWWGDILVTYAFCGFFLIALMRLKSSWMVALAIMLNALLHGFILFALSIQGIANMEKTAQFVDITMVQNAIVAYGTGTWSDAFTQRLADLSVQMSLGAWFASLFTILPYMLIGAAAAKWRLIERAKELKVMWLMLAIIGIGLGLFIKSAPYMLTYTNLLDYVKVFVGGPILALGYTAAIVVICLLPFALKLLSPFAKLGRMSMTMYIMQSIVCTFIFYNFGLGLYGKMSVQMGTYMALGIFAAQLVIAELWLSKFAQGPLEAIIKRFTYGEKLSEK
ncbi:DUF418 domain-containing protein [Metasolibacillus sp.]|uniref:DUF418 domain-containing protein n=1 Tax=Metasolibacillus sp. TaxID=2703680 RepID=UPI0025FC24C7|nr:DUF418 domain-containing protein [Metasolibacillus sp.]MCT6926081.1 DUF418 domain-containing protein [Metasolibacillus sp.]MCT6942288.1 DUF418 domain-containing protein [Metasolibacillus sp.]